MLHRFKPRLIWFALLSTSAQAQIAQPECWPLIDTATYQASSVYIGEGATCRWAQWYCYPVDISQPTKIITITGPKTIPITTILGRMLTIENAQNRQGVMSLMWKAYVGPADPACMAEVK